MAELRRDECVPRDSREKESERAERVPISAFVICCNEEDHILDCLKSLSFCDEVVVIDSYSSDRTVEIAKNWGAKVIQRKWSGFRDQKAFGLASVTYEWVLNLDADERISPELQRDIEDILQKEQLAELSGRETEINGYYVNRVVFFLGRWWRRGGWYPEYRLRMLKKSKTVWGGQDPHERPEVSGKTGTLAGELYHYTYESVDEQFKRLCEFSSISAKETFRAGRHIGPLQLVVNPVLRFLKFYFVKRGFLEGMAGFVVALNEACYTYMKYAKLWGRQWNERSNKERDHGQTERTPSNTQSL